MYLLPVNYSQSRIVGRFVCYSTMAEMKSVIPAAAGSSCAVMSSSTNNVLAMNQHSNQMSSFATHSTFNNCYFHMYTGPSYGNAGS